MGDVSSIPGGTLMSVRESKHDAPSLTALPWRLLCEVTHRLQQFWSPQEIARRLLIEFPNDPEMRVSHEKIYRSLFVQGRGELRRDRLGEPGQPVDARDQDIPDAGLVQVVQHREPKLCVLAVLPPQAKDLQYMGEIAQRLRSSA
jgi:IS30 family transposase